MFCSRKRGFLSSLGGERQATYVIKTPGDVLITLCLTNKITWGPTQTTVEGVTPLNTLQHTSPLFAQTTTALRHPSVTNHVRPTARPTTHTEPHIAAGMDLDQPTSLAIHSPTSLGPHTDQEPTGAHPHSLSPHQPTAITPHWPTTMATLQPTTAAPHNHRCGTTLWDE
ncbi:hypothetical protein PGT21_030645 [Puccinia graminis f. sp. tritici]|uniref:Uncharacterized protein n=1 Tax=Puccinia graminis f. sp. tritici TaxID=56615 RepID=A0A5B0PI64_PUCGR|nr:hypothetical protein PGT21_030645 [Puccinia graminis f. sp. tritici]